MVPALGTRRVSVRMGVCGARGGLGRSSGARTGVVVAAGSFVRRVGVGGVGAFAGAVGVNVDVPEDPRDVVAEDLGQNVRGEALGRVVEVERAAEAGDAV